MHNLKRSERVNDGKSSMFLLKLGSKPLVTFSVECHQVNEASSESIFRLLQCCLIRLIATKNVFEKGCLFNEDSKQTCLCFLNPERASKFRNFPT